MIAVVTGGNGFMGLQLVRDQLARGNAVRAVDLHRERLDALDAGPALEIFQADIGDAQTMRQIVSGADVVFHLASAHLLVSLGEEAYWRINREGARQLVRLCGEAGVGRFVHCSTVGVYGEISDPPADETTPCHPDLIYEKSKLAGEEAVRSEAERTGLPLVVIRPVWVYGSGCPRTQKLFRSLRKGSFVFIGSGRGLRHCIHIDDFSLACALCAVRPEAAGETFVIGDSGAITLRELMGHMAAACGCRRPWVQLPLFLARPLFAAVERLWHWLKREPPVSTRTLKFFTNNTAFSIAKARRLLGFEPRYDVAEGMRRTWEEIRCPRPAGGGH